LVGWRWGSDRQSQRGIMKFPGFIILVMAMVSWLQTFVRSSQIVYFWEVCSAMLPFWF
jgi:hypothetical protein